MELTEEKRMKYENIWKRFRVESTFLSTDLNNDDQLISLVKGCNYIDFLILSFVHTNKDDAIKIILCNPFLINYLKLNDVNYILKTLSDEDCYDGVIGFVQFIGKYVGVDSVELYCDLDIETNRIFKFIDSNRSHVLGLIILNEIDSEFIRNSGIDINQFNILRNTLLNEGASSIIVEP